MIVRCFVGSNRRSGVLRGNTMKKFIYILTVCTAIALGFYLANAAAAAEVTFQWDANDPAPEGYLLYVHTGDGFNYDNSVWQGADTTATVDLPDGIEHHAVVRAYDGDNQSGNSNEIVFILSNAGWVR